MPIAVFPVGYLDTNCYVVYNDCDAVIVDPGATSENGLDEVRTLIARNNLTVRAVVLTHLHFDHTYGVAELLREYAGLKAYACEKDFPMLKTALGRGSAFGLPNVVPFTPDPIEAGPFAFGSISGEILLTPGHSEGGLALYIPSEQAVLSGDTLFYRSVGRTDFDGGDYDTLAESVKNRLYTLPDNTTVYSGHGPATTVGDEKKQNPYVCG